MTISDDQVYGDDICHTCWKPHPWLDGTFPKHPFNDGRGTVSTAFMGPSRVRDPQSGVKTPQRGSQGPLTTVVDAPWPFDPVLRQALIDKGILTPEDLHSAEEKIRAVTAAFQQGGVVSGEQTEGTRGRQV